MIRTYGGRALRLTREKQLQATEKMGTTVGGDGQFPVTHTAGQSRFAGGGFSLTLS
jgi:hypothetical protein